MNVPSVRSQPSSRIRGVLFPFQDHWRDVDFRRVSGGRRACRVDPAGDPLCRARTKAGSRKPCCCLPSAVSHRSGNGCSIRWSSDFPPWQDRQSAPPPDSIVVLWWRNRVRSFSRARRTDVQCRGRTSSQPPGLPIAIRMPVSCFPAVVPIWSLTIPQGVRFRDAVVRKSGRLRGPPYHGAALRNTFENAEFGKALVSPKPGERWLLVTSVLHARSIGIFRRAVSPGRALSRGLADRRRQ